MGANREAIDPDKIPWDALRTLVGQTIFGGKIDNEFDQKILMSLVSYFFRKETFDVDYPLVNSPGDDSHSGLVIPDYKSYKDFYNWVKQLPGIESPAWSGLPPNVEKINRMRQADALVVDTKVLQGTGDEDMDVNDKGAKDDDGAAQWLVSLEKKIHIYLERLPEELKTLVREPALVKIPMFRFLEREVSILSSLLKTVKKDFALALDICTGEAKSNQYTKAIAESLHQDVVPKHWKKYIVPDTWTASEWLNDFRKRLD